MEEVENVEVRRINKWMKRKSKVEEVEEEVKGEEEEVEKVNEGRRWRRRWKG